jgi:hypothetical protein
VIIWGDYTTALSMVNGASSVNAEVRSQKAEVRTNNAHVSDGFDERLFTSAF